MTPATPSQLARLISAISAPSALKTKRKARRAAQRVALALVLTLSWTAGQADAQIYEPGSTVLGKTIGDWSKDYFNVAEAFGGGSITQVKTQPGPVFLLGGSGDIEVDVPAGAHLLHIRHGCSLGARTEGKSRAR